MIHFTGTGLYLRVALIEFKLRTVGAAIRIALLCVTIRMDTMYTRIEMH